MRAAETLFTRRHDMQHLNTQSGSTARAGPGARETTTWVGLHGLALVLWLSIPTPIHAQAIPASREARPTLNRTKDMTALKTVDAPHTTARSPQEETAIRPFRFTASDEALADLRRRVKATKWPAKETVGDWSQGVQLAVVQNIARYWATEYDWRKVEAKLNSYPQFITNIDGLDIHFIHVRSKHENALPVIVTHGWPGSIIEQLKIIDPLTDPTAYGGSASEAFDVVIPSMPGYGFSGKPTTTGWDQARIAHAWAGLMKRLGYTRYVAQGGDWGAIVNDVMATQGHPELIGFHTN